MHSGGGPSVWIRAMPALFVFIWATGYVVARFGMPHAPPLSFLALRYALSIACFGLWIAWSRPGWPAGRRQWLYLGLAGVLVHAGYLGGVWMAVKAGIGAGLAALIVNLQPVLTAIWVAWSTSPARSGAANDVGSGVTPRQWAGLALGFGGLVLVMSRKFGVDGAPGEATLANVGLCVFALLSMTTGALVQKRLVAACDVRTANVVQLGAALVVTLPFALLERQPMDWQPELIGAMAWSVLVLTLGGSSLFYLLLQRGAATAVTGLLYLVPPVTAGMAWVLFGEAITTTTVVGTALTALGVYWVVRAGRPGA